MPGPNTLTPPDGFVGDDDATFKQHLFDKTQAQGKPEIEPDRMSNDLRRKSVALVADGTKDHGVAHIVQIAATELT